MKSQKLLVIATIVCLLVGASSAAMARNDCPDGFLVGGTYEEIIINEFASCTILGVNVTVGVVIRNAANITIKGSVIDGGLLVAGSGNTYIVENQIQGSLVSRNNGVSNVVRNIVLADEIRVVDNRCEQNDQVEVVQNLVFGGKLIVKCQDRAAVIDNYVRDGSIRCNDKVSLISRGNYAEKVSCSASSSAF